MPALLLSGPIVTVKGSILAGRYAMQRRKGMDVLKSSELGLATLSAGQSRPDILGGLDD